MAGDATGAPRVDPLLVESDDLDRRSWGPVDGRDGPKNLGFILSADAGPHPLDWARRIALTVGEATLGAEVPDGLLALVRCLRRPHFQSSKGVNPDWTRRGVHRILVHEAVWDPARE